MSSSDLSLSRSSRVRFALIGGGMIALAAVAAGVAAVPSDPPSHYYSATFGRAGQGLDLRSQVKVRGMAVGGVESVSLDSRGRAVVRFRVDEDIKVPVTASVAIEPLSVFGPKDLTLDLGSGEGTGPYLKSEAEITKTTDPAELSDTGRPLAELTEALDPDDVSTVVHTLAQALRGNGEKLRRTTDNTRKVLDQLHGTRRETSRALKDAAALAGVLGDRTGALDQILDGTATLGETLGEDPEAFTSTLDNASVLADVLARTLKENGGDLATLIDKGSLLSGTLYGRQAELVSLIKGLNSLFGGLASIMQLPGPEGTLLGNTNLYISLNLCDELPDLCPAEWTYTDKDGAKNKKKKGNG